MKPPSLKHRLEALGMAGVGAVLRHLPYRLALALGWILAWMWHYLIRYRRKEARERIASVFPQFPPAKVRQIAWRSWRDFVFNGVEMFRLPAISEAWMGTHVVNLEEMKSFLQQHQMANMGGIIASPHMGAAEMAAVILQRLGLPMFMITGRQKNPLTDEQLNRLRASTGIPYVQKGSNLLRQVISQLRQGGILAFLPDLRVDRGGIDVPFLGKTAHVAPGMALFAKQTRVPIYPLIITREGWTRHRLTFHPPLFPDVAMEKRADQERLAREVFAIMDQAVRHHPEQWFWFNKNWILNPPRSEEPTKEEPDT
jgi:KDO2-lipid IV(A) lauroyltransferase